MKKLLLSALMFITILSSTTTFANSNENIYNMEGTMVKISIADDKSLIVNVGNVQGETITIAFEDEEGVVLLTEKIAKTFSFIKKYKVSKLDRGRYTLVVTKNSSKTLQPFEVADKDVIIGAMEKNDKFIPTVSFTENKLRVNVLLGNYSNITVKILDAEKNEVLDDRNYVVASLNKSFNLTALSKGIYLIEIIAGDERFCQTIEK